MHTNTMIHFRAAVALFLLFWGKMLAAQCLQMLDCPAAPVVVCDSVNNDYYLWSEPYWWSAVYAGNDLREGAVDLCFSVSDTCVGADLQIRYQLFLDLDGDGDRETVVRSDSLPAFGHLLFGNAENPDYAGGELRRFDRRPVPETQRFGFAIEQTGTASNRTPACAGTPKKHRAHIRCRNCPTARTVSFGSWTMVSAAPIRVRTMSRCGIACRQR